MTFPRMGQLGKFEAPTDQVLGNCRLRAVRIWRGNTRPDSGHRQCSSEARQAQANEHLGLVSRLLSAFDTVLTEEGESIKAKGFPKEAWKLCLAIIEKAALEDELPTAEIFEVLAGFG